MSTTAKQVQELESTAEKHATENLQWMEQTEATLEDVEKKLKRAKEEEKSIINEESQVGGGKKRKKEIKLDKETEAELEDAFNKIREAKADLDEIIPVFKNNKILDVVVGFGDELYSSRPDDDLMEQIHQALVDEVGELSRDQLEKMGRLTNNVMQDVLEAREDIRYAAKELKAAMGHEEEHLEYEESKELNAELKKEFQFIEEIIEELETLVQLDKEGDNLTPIANQEKLDMFLSGLKAASKLETWEENH